MKRIPVIVIAAILAHIFCCNKMYASTTCVMNNTDTVKGDYAMIHGMKMYYIIQGEGTPLVLLHGAFSNIDKDFGKMIPFFAQTHRVIAVEMQGHGHTNDISRPLSYDSMAEDIVALLQQLNISKADFFGYSMGGGVALQCAIKHPQLINHLILASTAYSPSGMNMDNPHNLKLKPQTDLNQSVWKKQYDAIAPDTSHWKTLVQKMYSLMGSWKGFDSADIKNIKAPTLLIFGDADISNPEHAVEMFRLLGGGVAGDIYERNKNQLAILPNTTHVEMVDQTALLEPIVTNFLAVPVQ